MGDVERSTVPVRHGFPNPKLGKILEMMKQLPQYRELTRGIREVAAQTGGDLSLIREKCVQAGIRDKFVGLVAANQSVLDNEPVLGAAPPTTALYGLFGRGTEVIDVGTGNCMKVKRFTGELKITAVDPLINNEGHVLKCYEGSLDEYVNEVKPADPLYSSWMSAGQLSESELVHLERHDGVHLVPDHDILIDQGIAHAEGPNVLVRTVNGTFVDRRIEWQGMPITPGYLLCPTFRERKLDLCFPSTRERGDYVPVSEATPTGFFDLDFTDITPKFDGFYCEFELLPTEAMLTYRSGDYMRTTHNQPHHLCLALEELGEVYMLLRIIQYRGYVPPHCGKTLRLFCSKYKITINGKPVLAPQPWSLADFNKPVTLHWDSGGQARHAAVPVDGVISRVDGCDRYCKYMWTVDLLADDINRVRHALKEHGYSLQVSGEWFDGINELQVQRGGSLVLMKVVRPRPDKHNRTSTETVLHLIDRPTLGEQSVICELSSRPPPPSPQAFTGIQ